MYVCLYVCMYLSIVMACEASSTESKVTKASPVGFPSYLKTILTASFRTLNAVKYNYINCK